MSDPEPWVDSPQSGDILINTYSKSAAKLTDPSGPTGWHCHSTEGFNFIHQVTREDYVNLRVLLWDVLDYLEGPGADKMGSEIHAVLKAMGWNGD